MTLRPQPVFIMAERLNSKYAIVILSKLATAKETDVAFTASGRADGRLSYMPKQEKQDVAQMAEA